MNPFYLFVDCEPIRLEEAVESKKWRNAIDKEIKAIEEKKLLGAGTFTKRKKDWSEVDIRSQKESQRRKERYKTRFVAKNYSQQYGNEYYEAFASIDHLETIRLIILFAAQNKLKIFEMDVKSAFLNSYLEEEVYVEPTGYILQVIF